MREPQSKAQTGVNSLVSAALPASHSYGNPKPPKGAGDLVLYLDYDGVLHHENVLWHSNRGAYLVAGPKYRLFQHAPLLEQLLTPYPDIRIVLSTSWARVYGCSKAAKRLPPTLRSRVIGATFYSRMNEQAFLSQSRGMQVWADVLRRKPRDWLALDDDTLDWPHWCRNKLIATDETEGISDPGMTQQIEQRLRDMAAQVRPPQSPSQPPQQPPPGGPL